jgi:phage/plasmid-like protein (TIGR03299 family)
MSHEMYKNDHAVFAGKRAWHGLGTVVESAPTPGQALSLAKLDWQVIGSDGLFADHFTEEDDDQPGPTSRRTAIHTHKALVRSDDWSVLSMVGKDYEILQNDQLAEFCYALAEEDDIVRVESAGSLRGGRRVWFLLRGESLTIDKENDIIEPYIMAYNSHDGSSALDTKIRVVCNNTLTAARAYAKERTFKFRHTGSILERVSAATTIMRRRFQGMQDWAESIGDKSQTMTVGEANTYFDTVFDALWKERESTERAEAARNTKRHAFRADCHQRLEYEVDQLGLRLTNWTAANAVTHWLDHSASVVLRGDSKHNSVDEARAFNNLFGITADKKATAFHLAGLPTA